MRRGFLRPQPCPATGAAVLPRALTFKELVGHSVFRSDRSVAGDALSQTVQDNPSSDPSLFARYRLALRRYVAAAASLEGLTGPDFAEAYRRAVEARSIYEQLRAQLIEDQGAGSS